MAETLLVHIKPQPDFPHVDLTEENADFLELILANEGLVAQWHDDSELVVPMFRTSHPVLRAASTRSVQGIDIPALEHGLQLFEVITCIVGSEPGDVNEAALIVNAVTLTTTSDSNGLSRYFLEAREVMQDELARTTSVVKTAAGRFFPKATDSALLGAAIARQFELDNIGPLKHRTEE